MALVLALIALILLAAGGGFALVFVWRRRRKRRLPGWQFPHITGAPRCAVVLAHGIMGFDEIGIGGRRAAYFRGIAERLDKMGAKVYRPTVSPVGSIERRADELRAFVRALKEPRVNIVAHSMGGLDARCAISKMGLGPRVESLSTIGTPHRGTPLADVLRGVVGEQRLLRRALSACGVPADGFHELTAARLERFNRDVRDDPGVAYYSVVCGFSGDVGGLRKALLPSYMYLHARAGANDGLVPAASQEWGIAFDHIEADHFAQMGWSDAFDAPSFYEKLVQELRGRGH